MNLKVKLAMSSIAGLLGIAGITGGATYAFLTGHASNNSNMFTAGKLSLSATRNDIPLNGPMFYTDNSSLQASGGGLLGTGYWVPGDIKTRGMFIQNTGDVDGKLTNLIALPQNSSGTVVSSTSTGSDLTTYQNDMAFADEAMVTIQVWQRNAGDDTISANDFNAWLHNINSDYERDLNLANIPFLKGGATFAAVANQMEGAGAAGLLDGTAYDLYHDGKGDVTPVAVWTGPLSQLIGNQGGLNVPASLTDVTLAGGHSMFMTYTVSLPDLGAANNNLNGLGGTYFGFESDFSQAANNTPALLPGMTQGTVYTASDSTISAPAASGIWNTANAGTGGAANGVPLVFSTTVTGSNSMTIQFNADDVSEVYVDGQPKWVESSWASPQTVTIPVSAGQHTIQFFAENTAGEQPGTVTYNPTVSSSNPAIFNAVVTDSTSGTVLASTASPSEWSVQQPTASTPNPYMYGATTQTSGAYDSKKANYNHPTTGTPIGPALLDQ